MVTYTFSSCENRDQGSLAWMFAVLDKDWSFSDSKAHGSVIQWKGRVSGVGAILRYSPDSVSPLEVNFLCSDKENNKAVFMGNLVYVLRPKIIHDSYERNITEEYPPVEPKTQKPEIKRSAELETTALTGLPSIRPNTRMRNGLRDYISSLLSRFHVP